MFVHIGKGRLGEGGGVIVMWEGRGGERVPTGWGRRRGEGGLLGVQSQFELGDNRLGFVHTFCLFVCPIVVLFLFSYSLLTCLRFEKKSMI